MKILLLGIKINFAIAIFVLVLFPIVSLGTRLSWWHYTTAFQLLKLDVLLGFLVILLSIFFLIVAWVTHTWLGARVTAISLIFAAIIVVPFLYQFYLVNTLPKIHDITTDWIDPPHFSAVIIERPASSNPLMYAGEVIAEQQRAAYPDLVSLTSALAPQEAFVRANAVVEKFGWHLVATDPTEGLIEATDTSFWFGFKDDIVIRVQATQAGGSKIDVRSVSRVGLSDIGANANRIRKFIGAFDTVGN